MNTNTSHGSAQIYQFPTNGRGGRTSSRTMPDVRSPSIANIDFGSGWYHDAAIVEAAPRAKVAHSTGFSSVVVPLTFPRQ